MEEEEKKGGKPAGVEYGSMYPYGVEILEQGSHNYD